MPKYKFVGDGPRVFPDLSLEVNPGDVVEIDDDDPPGGEMWWVSVPAKTKTTDEKAE